MFRDFLWKSDPLEQYTPILIFEYGSTPGVRILTTWKIVVTYNITAVGYLKRLDHVISQSEI